MSLLCYTFQNIANRIWRAIADAHKAGLSYGEETITETTLLQLAWEFPHHFRIKAFSKKQEGRNGSDWEWWIGGYDRWLGMRVQAKKIRYGHDEFWRLQSYKRRGSADKQIDVLLRQARKDRLNPVYCLYVSSENPAALRYATSCRRHYCQFHLGCVIGDAVAIRATGSNKLNDLAQVCYPWHCLVCECPCCPPPGGHTAYGDGLANAAFAALQQSRRAIWEYGIEGREGIEDFPWFEPQESLPDYLQPMQAGEGADDPDDRLRGIAEERGLSGFVILQEGELR